MGVLDCLLLAWLALEFLIGLKLGLVYRVGNLLGLLAATLIGGQVYFSIIKSWALSDTTLFIGFLISLVAAMVVAGVVARKINIVHRFLEWIPLFKTANKIVGGVVAVLVHTVFLSLVAFVVQRLNVHPTLTQIIEQSPVVTVLASIGLVLSYLLPQAMRDVNTTVV